MFSLDKRGFPIAVLMVLAAAYVASRLDRRAPAPGKRRLDPDAVVLPRSDDEGVTYARVEVVRPVRDRPDDLEDRKLPRAVSELASDKHLGYRWLHKHLCAGDEKLLDRLESEFGDETANFESVYGMILDWCGNSALCDRAHQRLDAGITSPFQHVLYSRVLSACDLPSVGALLDGPVSYTARLRWRAKFSAEPPFQLALEVLDAGPSARTYDVWPSLQSRLSPPEVQALRELIAHSPQADWLSPERPQRFDAGDPRDLAERLSKTEGLAWALTQRDGGLTVASRDALATCARSTGPGAESCLTVLSEAQWSFARQVASSLPQTDKQPMRALLSRFESQEAIAASLRAVGLDAGRVWGLSSALFQMRLTVEASALTDLAGAEDLVDIAQPELNDVVIRTHSARTASDGAKLEAWLGDARYTFVFAPGCNVEDPTAVLGFVNVLLRERPAARRCFTAQVLGDSNPMVVLMLPAQFEALVDAGVFVSMPAHIAANAHRHDRDDGPLDEP